MTYYIFINGQETGPLTFDELRSYRIQPATRVWRTDMPRWVEARHLAELGELLSEASPFSFERRFQHDTVSASQPTAYFDRISFLPRLDKDHQWLIRSVLLFLGSIVLLVLAIVLGTWEEVDQRSADTAVLLVYIGIFLFIVGAGLTIFFFCRVQYACWTIVQDGTKKPSPAEAVGFMFIPYFNLYWAFVSFHRLSGELNKKAGEADPGGSPRAQEGLSRAYCILFIGCWIPLLGLLLIPPAIVLFCLVMGNHKKVAHRIAQGYALGFHKGSI